MAKRRLIGRRSFLLSVTGTAGLFSAMAVLPEEAQARIGDTDRGRHADRSSRRRSGLTDSDTGRMGDLPGYGRGGRGSRTGVTDRDSGRHADRAGHGRGRSN